MEEERRLLPQPTLVTMLTGGLSALLGLAVLVGWYTHNTTLVQVVPTWVPMHYNAALGFLLCGIELLTLASGRSWLAVACSLGVVMLGLLPLIEDVFDVHLGIDQLPLQPSIKFTPPPPPRLAQNATLSFVLAGTAVLVMSLSGELAYTSLIPGLLGTMVCALGLIACLEYMSGAKLAQDWGRHSYMAIHAAAGFIMLGSGIVVHALHVRWVVPPERRAAVQDLSLAVEQSFSRALQQARDSREVTIIRAPGLLPNSLGLQIWTPLFLRANFDGFLVGLLHTQELFDAILQHIAHGYLVTVFMREEEIYSSAPLSR